jgi:hypothetical protein
MPKVTVKRYYEEECLSSSDGEEPFNFYILVRILKTWTTESGEIKETWKRTSWSVSGKTEEDAKRKLVDFIKKKGLEPYIEH